MLFIWDPVPNSYSVSNETFKIFDKFLWVLIKSRSPMKILKFYIKSEVVGESLGLLNDILGHWWKAWVLQWQSRVSDEKPGFFNDNLGSPMKSLGSTVKICGHRWKTRGLRWDGHGFSNSTPMMMISSGTLLLFIKSKQYFHCIKDQLNATRTSNSRDIARKSHFLQIIFPLIFKNYK